MAYDEGLAQRIREVVVDYPTIAEKKMFGGIAFMLHDYMFCGVIDDRLMARVGPDNYADALTRPHVEKMDFTGREMKGYVYVDATGIEEDDSLQQWVTRCADFVQTLPPKKPKQKK
ncbi:MAG: TfoX/Sxy family protein [Anaerolineae bacterium]|nr:TfoX/Sxy family protein [Anaerolineae bacterium]